MLFNSLHYAIFFPIVVALYYFVPHKFRHYILIGASSYFYMTFVPAYILILYLIIIVDYTAGIAMEKYEKHKKNILLLSIISNVGLLFFFKYFNFFNENIAHLAQLINWNYSPLLLSIALPLGLSFHTFQSLSYIFEVYKGKQKAEYNLGIYAVYVMFFPQLVAGPIERPQHLLGQFKQEHKPTPTNFTLGFRQMLWGFFKKLVIADNLAPIVDTAFSTPHELNGLSLLIASIAFVIQIYGDFSGYSDIAIGSAKIIGFNLADNFKKPFFARTIADFWRRWHITLTLWFQDYVFTPLYMKATRSSAFKNLPHKKRHYISFSFATIIGLTLLGLWHGANWTFVIFGLTQGIGIIGYYTFKKHWDSLFIPLQILLTFSIFLIGSIFFRANNIFDGIHILRQILLETINALTHIPSINYIKQSILDLHIFNLSTIYILIGSIGFMLYTEWVTKNNYEHNLCSKKTKPIRIAYYYIMITIIFLFAQLEKQPFIYFQF